MIGYAFMAAKAGHPLTDRLHAMGLRAGIYSDIGRVRADLHADVCQQPEGTLAWSSNSMVPPPSCSLNRARCALATRPSCSRRPSRESS